MRILPLIFVTPVCFLFVVGLTPGCSSDRTAATPAALDAGRDTSIAPVTCGQAGSLCTGSEWCQYDLVGTCGRDGQTGKCSARPSTCPGDCPVVCGCDGQIYCNSCAAKRAGADVDKNRNCVPSPGEVTATSLPTDPLKIVIFKKDVARSICLRVTLIRRLGTLFGLDVPADWGVDSSEITNDPGDCSITVTGLPLTPKGTALRPNGGQGAVAFSPETGQGGTLPCKLSVGARLSFDTGPDFPWVPNVEVLDADTITVAGACQ